MDNVVLAGQLVVGISIDYGMGVHLVPPVEQPAEADLGVGHGAADGEGGAEGRGAGRGLVECAGRDAVSSGHGLFQEINKKNEKVR